MKITAAMVKELREATGAGVMDCKEALEAAGGDFDLAVRYLREKSISIAAKKVGRAVNEGLIGSYIHAGGRVGVLIEVNCETDFVARTEEFKELVHDLAMQVAATNPLYLAPDEIPPDVVKSYLEESGNEDVAEGKLEEFYQEKCLLCQPFIKDNSLTVQELIMQKIAKFGENIVVRRFVRYELGGGDA